MRFTRLTLLQGKVGIFYRNFAALALRQVTLGRHGAQ